MSFVKFAVIIVFNSFITDIITNAIAIIAIKDLSPHVHLQYLFHNRYLGNFSDQ